MTDEDPQRFRGERLRVPPHVGIIFCDSIGDFVVALPLLQAIREVYPDCDVDYFGGPRTAELESASPLITDRFDLFGDIFNAGEFLDFRNRRISECGKYDLVVNLDSSAVAAWATGSLVPRYVVGRCVTVDGRADLDQPLEGIDKLHSENWAEAGLADRYAGLLRSQHISEIFCAIAHFPYPRVVPSPPCVRPSLEIPDVLLGLGATRSAKLWPTAHWKVLVEYILSSDLTAGILGATDDAQQRYYNSWETENDILNSYPVQDLRGRLTLPEVSGALAMARACVSIDNGIMHLSLSCRTPTVAIFGGSAWRLWARRSSNLYLVLPDEPCDLCQANRYRNRDCLLDYKICMNSCRPESVAEALHGALG
jgi:heptosyltransferase-3